MLQTKELAFLDKKWAGFGLVCLLIAAFFSKGFHHFDEHFQILEFAAFKLGRLASTDLPWEFHAKMRPALQPFLAFSTHRFLLLLNREDPFLVAFVLRLLTAVLSWLAFVLVLKTFAKEIPKKEYVWITLPLSFFFWLSIYNGVRFSSENWGGIFFALGLCLAYPPFENSRARGFLSGVLLGVSFVSRFQMGFMILGLGMWLLALKKEKLSNLITLFLGFCAVLFLEWVLAHWLYGGWPVTFWNYFEQNLLQGRAVQFGIKPWYYYFTVLFLNLIPPFSLLFVVSVFAFFWFFPKHVLSFSLLPFLFFHLAMGHKESRFLFPLLYLFPVIVGLGVSVLSRKLPLPRGLFWGFGAINGALLLAILFLPADKDTELYEAIYRLNPERLIFSKHNPYQRADLDLEYYRRPKMEILASSDSQVSNHAKPKTLIASEDTLDNTAPERILYRTAPLWVRHFNFNHWLERTRLWVLFWQ